MCMSMWKPVAFVRWTRVSRCQHLDCCNLFPFLMELDKVSLWIFLRVCPKVLELIMVVVDRLTKYSHFLPLSNPSVEQVFLDQVYKLHGLPSSIITDREGPDIYQFLLEVLIRGGQTAHGYGISPAIWRPNSACSSMHFNILEAHDLTTTKEMGKMDTLGRVVVQYKLP